jgi:3-oxoadipate enol-lactonase
MSKLTLPGYNIHYTVEGSPGAPLLVLSNSLGAETSMWNAQVPEFSLHFRVLRYDNRGHGQSTPPKGPYTLEDVANDAALLLAHLGESSVHFCGLSLGGMVGMWLAAHHPGLIAKLVLCNTSALLGPRENWDTRIAAVKQGGMQAIVKATMERWFTEGFRSGSPGVIAAVEQSFLAVSVEGYTGCCAAIRDMDQRETISQIKAETLVISGTYDPATPPAMGRFIAEAIPGARYVELPTAHLSNIEAESEFNGVVSQFLATSL